MSVFHLMPGCVREAIPAQPWRRERLWSLILPVEEVEVASLSWLLDVPFWSHQGQPFRLSPNQVRHSPSLYQEQYQRTMACDLDYPIHLVYFNGRWTILDGIHRLLKAAILEWEHIRVMKLSGDGFRCILVSASE